MSWKSGDCLKLNSGDTTLDVAETITRWAALSQIKLFLQLGYNRLNLSAAFMIDHGVYAEEGHSPGEVMNWRIDDNLRSFALRMAYSKPSLNG